MTDASRPSEKLGTDSKSSTISIAATLGRVSGTVTLVYGDDLMKHPLSAPHPLQPIRVQLTMEQTRATGLIEHCPLVPPRMATVAELELVHSPEYVELVQKLSDPAQRGLIARQRIVSAGFDSPDNPISDELHEGTALVAGASPVRAEAIARGAALHVFSPAGGLHQ